MYRLICDFPFLRFISLPKDIYCPKKVVYLHRQMSYLILKPIHLIMTISSLSQILRSAFLAGVRIGWLKRMSVRSSFPPPRVENMWKMPTFSLENEHEKV